MGNDYSSIQYRNQAYLIPTWLLKKYADHGIKLDESNLSKILCNKPAHVEQIDDTTLIVMLIEELNNLRLYDSEHGLGKIVVYSPQIRVYNSLSDAVIDDNKGYMFNFLKYHESGIFPTTNIGKQFGIEFTTHYSNKGIRLLNLYVKSIYRDANGKALQDYYDSYRNLGIEQSIDSFRTQLMKNSAFGFALYYDRMLRKHNTMHCTSKNQAGQYQTNMQRLIEKYKGSFEDVSDLNKYSQVSGIYVLCLGRFSKCYIGQTSRSIKHRIVDHFVKPQTEFDSLFDFSDITRLFVLRVNPDELDEVEQDCIASIDKDCLLNVMAGGDSLEMISDPTYNPKEFFLSRAALKRVIKSAETMKKDHS